MKALVKSVGEAVLVESGWSRVRRRAVRRRTVILAYHNVVPDSLGGRGDASLHLPVSRFRAHLERIARVGRVIPLAEAIDPARRSSGTEGRPSVVITLDDAYRGALTLGLDLLAERGMPATVFAAPALLGDRAPWWDRLADGGGDGVAAEVRERVLRAGGGEPEARRASASVRGEPPQMPWPMRIGTAEELEQAARRPGVRVGSHTWSHRNLPALDDATLQEELSAPRGWLRHRLGEDYIDVVSYPYGRVGERSRAAATRAGYAAGLTLDGRWLPEAEGQDRRLALPRLNVPGGTSPRGLVLRLSRDR